MARRVLSVLAGLLAGFFVVAAIEALSNRLYPWPADLDKSDLEAIQAHIASLPASALALVWLAHGAGALAAGFVCVAISRAMWRVGPIVLGVLLLSAGVTNLVMIPHPWVFTIADVLVYIPAALFGGALATRLPVHRESQAQS